MKRLPRFNREWLPLGLVGVLWAGSACSVWAQSANGNPLRPVSKSTSTAVQPAAAIGTAVRTTEKRTPVIVSNANAEAPSTPVRQQVSPDRRRSGSPGVSSSQGVSQATYRRRVGRPPSGLTSTHKEYVGTSVLNGTVTVRQNQKANEIIDGGTIYEEGAEPMLNEHAEGDCCGVCNGMGCNECCLIPCPRIPWDDLTIFGGVQGFTGPKNLGQAGSFGFHEGLNWGAPLPCMNGCLGMQVGARFTQSNLSGTEFTGDTRHQTFLTTGLFRRVDWGLQGGVAFDYLKDDWYTNTELTQLRAELSWVFPCSHELGFWMTHSLDDDTQATQIFVAGVPVAGEASWEATDLYAFFYRHQFSDWEGANCRLFAGWTGDSDGFIGTDFQVPLTCDLALQAGFAYLVPDEAKGPADTGNEQESWNVGISLVWYPGCGTANSKSYFAPLFNVADNGSFMVDQLP